MKSAPVEDRTPVPVTPLVAVALGFFFSVFLLMASLGGYILGHLLLLLAVVAAPVVGAVALIRWAVSGLAGPQAAGPSLGVPQDAEAQEPDEEADLLRTADILKGLSDQQLGRVAAIGKHVHLPQGTLLARQGDIGSDIYIILEGQAQLTASSSRGEITLRVAGPGESFPLAALLGTGTLITTAYAMTDFAALVIPRNAFQQLCREQSEIGVLVYQAVADILGSRYGNTLARLVETQEQALRFSDMLTNM